MSKCWKISIPCVCVDWRSERHCKLLARCPTPVAQSSFLLLQWWFHLFSLIIPVDIKLSQQAGGYIVQGFAGDLHSPFCQFKSLCLLRSNYHNHHQAQLHRENTGKEKRRQRFRVALSQKYEIWLLCSAAELKSYPVAPEPLWKT